VDDGSTDGTYAVSRRFSCDRVSVVTQTNQGAAAARNTAFSLSKGDYIQWLDADDLLAPDKISLQVQALSDSPNPQLLLSSAWGHFLYRTQRTKFVASPLWTDLTPLEWLLRKMEHDVHMQPATWLVSRELTQAAGPWDTRLFVDDDGEYFCRVLLASEGTRFVPNAKVYYRITGSESVSYVGDSDKKLEAQLLSSRLHVNYVLSLDQTERSRAACLKYLQKYVSMFHERRPDLVEEMQIIATALDGHLQSPALPWKYAWMHRLFGWKTATRTRRHYNALKGNLARTWDRTLFDLERSNALRRSR
jgi:glycosyltransferase involved in cell wall biosynthesis